MTIAAAYHSVRAATPQHPAHRVVEAASAAFYLPIRPAQWEGSRLTPTDPTAWAGPDAFRTAAGAVRRTGLDVEAWVVLTHSSVLGRANPDLCVTSAFGDVYSHALCPSAPEVREYGSILVAETVDCGEVSSVLIESCGPMGFTHLGHHEKTQGADWTGVDADLLSVCFCSRCCLAYGAEGLDADPLRAAVGAAVGSGAPSVDDALGADAAVVLEVRDGFRQRLAADVASAARGAGAGTLRFSAQPAGWGTGPYGALLSSDVDADGFVLPAGLMTGHPDPATLVGDRRLGVQLSALPAEGRSDLDGLSPGALDAVDDVFLYHFGLLSATRRDALTTLIAQRFQIE